MKIKELHLRNIASIESADIDFENGLDDRMTGRPAATFLISGDTGTGKSVILDGIAMALYKKTPRIAGVANKLNNDFVDSEGQTVNVTSIEQYTRLGISENDECYSELVFEGNDGLEYRAKLKLGMMRGNADSEGRRPLKHRSPSWTVKVGGEDWRTVEARTGQPILDAVGLSFEQFGRMAMLAQGQFAAFLTGDKSERESILEQLTNTERFSVYGKAVGSLYARAKVARDTAETVRNTEKEHVLPEEEVARLRDRLAELKSAKASMDDEADRRGKTLELVAGVWQAVEGRRHAEEQIYALAQRMEGEEYRRSKALVADWDATHEERRAYAEKADAERRREAAVKRLEAAHEAFDALSADLAYREQVLEAKVLEVEALEAWVESRKELDEVYTKSEAVAMQLQQYADTRVKIEKDRGEMAQRKERAKVLAEACSNASAREAEARSRVEDKQREIEAVTAERNALNPSEVNEALKVGAAKRQSLETLRDRMARMEESRKAVEEQEKTLVRECENLKELEEKYRSAQKDYEAKYEQERRSRSLLSSMEMSASEVLVDLRRRMVEDHAETCPLCGQQIGSHHLDDDFSHLLSPLRTMEEEAARELASATAVRDEAKRQRDTLGGAIEAKKKACAADRRAIDAEWGRIAELATALGIDADRPIGPQIVEAIAEAELQNRALEQLQQKAVDLQTKVDGLMVEKKPLEEAWTAVREASESARREEEINKAAVANIEAAVESLERELGKLAKSLEEAVGGHYASWQSDTQSVLERFRADAAEYCGRKAEAANGRTKVENAKVALSAFGETRAAIIEKHGDWAVEVTPAAGKVENHHAAWTSLHSETNHQDQELADAAAIVEKAGERLAAYYAASGKDEPALVGIINAARHVDEARRRVGDTDAGMKSLRDAVSRCNENEAALLFRLGVESEDQVPDKGPIEAALGELKERQQANVAESGAIESQISAYERNRAQLEEAEAAFAKAQAVYEKWDRMNRVFGGSRFRTLVQTYILRPLLNNANIYLEKITDRYVLTCSEDNEQLSILVLDRYNKNQVRSVTVLSGGERFMISLALSLALSSLNRQDMNVNILFIDEGFGTLDETNLNSVMATLEKLQEIAGQSSRRVGIISHREELEERIPVKIHVRKRGEGRSIVEVTNGV